MTKAFIVAILLGCSTVLGQVRPQRAAGMVNSPAIAATPPMGWNSWPVFGSGDDPSVRAIADAMVANGLVAAGYQYIGIDDGWDLPTRDINGNLRADPRKFPNGMAALITYVHSDGLKFGVYLSAGTASCAGDAGSYGNEDKDAALLAAWGADLVKWDAACNVPDAGPPAVVRISKALRASGRGMLLACCAMGYGPFFYAAGAQSARIGADMAPPTWATMLAVFTANSGIAQFGGPNHWLDLDAMVVGEGVTDTEGQTSFSLWAIQAAPLLFGADIRAASSPSAATIATLTNSDVIAVDQDALGITGLQASSTSCGDSTCQVWLKPLSGGAWAIALFNLASTSQTVATTWSALHSFNAAFPNAPFTTTRDLWTHSSLGSLASGYSTTVASHGVAMIKVAPPTNVTWASTDFESGTIPAPFYSGAGCVVTTAFAHSGTHSVLCTANASGAQSYVKYNAGQYDPANPQNAAMSTVSATGVYFRWYFKIPSTTSSQLTAGQIKLHLARYDDANNPNYPWLMIGMGDEFSCSPPYTQLSAWIDYGVHGITGGCTGIDLAADSNWHSIEVWYFYDVGASLGHASFWVDGVQYVNNVTSAQMGLNNALDSISFRAGIAYTQNALSYPLQMYVDDLVISNHYNGP